MNQKSESYPSREEAIERWHILAREIAATISDLSESPGGAKPEKPGRLTVLGSGIGTLGFTRDAEQYIRSADHVFYCVADAATEVWLRKLRPDAYDLYVFYEDKKRRYFTYMQMSEAILYYVRQGKSVAVIYYGHPGIFVLSTHRAIAIARREGHYAQMRPGISALDCLCADLGIDPAYPGMQTFEATDLLLRQRRPDPSLHVILWQVGLIGELGFRRRGFINNHFDLLIKYLQDRYGKSYQLTHYVASRYPTLPPVIEPYRLDELYSPVTRARITGISTFYIPPKEARPIDREFGEAVGILRKKDRLGPPSPIRVIDRYGPLELRALRELADFEVPPDYHYQEETGAAGFLIALAESEELRKVYREEPRRAVSQEHFAGLTPREQRLLASRQPARVQIAAKGSGTSWSPSEQFVVDLLSKQSLAIGFNAILQEYATQTNGYQPIDAWIASQGYPGVSILNYSTAAANVRNSLLLAWSGVYVMEGNEPMVLTVLGNPASNAGSTVLINSTLIYNPSFANSTLTWTDTGGNVNSGSIQFALPDPSASGFLRQATGSVWTGSTPPFSNNFEATEVLPPDNPLGVWTGEYATQVSQDGDSWTAGPTITVFLPDANNPEPYVTLDSQPVTGFTFSGSQLSWDGGANLLTFAMNPNTQGVSTLTGQLEAYPHVKATSTANYSSSYHGQYVTTISKDGKWEPYLLFYFDSTRIVIGQQTITGATYSNRRLQWSGAGGANDSGDLNFSVNPNTNQAVFQGFVWAAGTTKPTTMNFQGTFSTVFLQSWSGTYITTLKESTGNVKGPQLFIEGQPLPQKSEVFYNATSVPYSYFGAQLSAQVDSSTSFKAVFSYAVSSDTSKRIIRSFNGQLTQSGKASDWFSASQSNDVTLWGGTYNTLVPGPNGTQIPGPNLQITATSATEYTVALIDTTTNTPVPISEATYTAEYFTLSWTDSPGTPSGSYANAAIAFYDDANAQTKSFKGSFWAQGQQPPKTPNWTGSIPPQPKPKTPFPWYYIVVPVLTVGIGVALAMLWKFRFSNRIANQIVSEAEKVVLCKKD